MTDSFTYFPNPINPNSTFTLTYTASQILSPIGNYELFTVNDEIISNFSPIYTFCASIIIPHPPPKIPTLFGSSPLIQYPLGVALDYTGDIFITNLNSFSVLKLNTHNLNFVNVNANNLVNNSINSLHITPFNLIPIDVEVACFTKGSLVLVNNSYCKIEDLQVGTLIKTFGKITKTGTIYTLEKINSYSKIRGIGKKMFNKLTPNEKPVIIYKNALNENEPFEDIYFSKKHLILVKDKLEHCMYRINNTAIF